MLSKQTGGMDSVPSSVLVERKRHLLNAYLKEKRTGLDWISIMDQARDFLE